MTEERRKTGDRRKRDIGPPEGWLERRKSAERRLPKAEESELSDDEFAQLFGAMAMAKTTAKLP